MIISASRRTDIPAFYSEWLLNRLQEGYALIPNPRNPLYFSRVRLNPEIVDCLVFWTKNPAPMIPKLSQITAMGYPFYFQFTLNPYGANIEQNLPDKKTRIQTFQTLSRILGPERVVWRYDPVILTKQMDVAYHIQAFEKMALALEGFTHRCIFSFLDFYPKIRGELQALGGIEMQETDMRSVAAGFAQIAGGHKIRLFTCCETVDLNAYGIAPGACIDASLIEEILDCSIYYNKDINQRAACRCMESVEIGTYDGCAHGCQYCYAISSERAVRNNMENHDPQAPVLFGNLPEKAIIHEKKMISVKDGQMRLF
ncbi:DUF1848 domain-containing protein [Aminipila butyrica]|uniref:DUF1848 domain-containing protein n=1 Tax=Aminipila butyrica TaxID=433296 RepID=A0A858BV89_9FIRM|nr:DUF1848 domain-containing protein [Aminipila butyrica]QIB69312.1 DUF1848 domain-containing protein [Aminipila butyrica]